MTIVHHNVVQSLRNKCGAMLACINSEVDDTNIDKLKWFVHSYRFDHDDKHISTSIHIDWYFQVH